METSDLEEEASLLISDFKTAKYGAVRITVNSVQVELKDNGKFDEVNYEGEPSAANRMKEKKTERRNRW